MVTNQKDLSAEGNPQFEIVLSFIKTLIDKGIIRIAISLPSEIQLVYDPKLIETEIKALGIDLRQFEKDVEEIPMMMTAILMHDENSLIHYFISKQKASVKEPDFNEEQVKKAVTQRLDLIRRLLVTDSLTRQLAIKRTSKTNVLSRLAWEINEKHYDEGGIPPQQLIYATLRLELQKQPFPEIPKPLSLILDKHIESIGFDASVEDIDALELTLASIKKRLLEFNK